MFTIGHSTRGIGDFISLLKEYCVIQIVDIRTFPRSRRNPQFNKDELTQALEAEGIGYLHMKGLGGFRRPIPGSVNGGLRNENFRGFADYMQTAEFDENLSRLMALARSSRVALMCAEALPWRCHRSLVSDALAVRRVKVGHIFGRAHCEAHRITSQARAEGSWITYPPRRPDSVSVYVSVSPVEPDRTANE